MTAYVAATSNTGAANTTLGLLAATYQTRISKIECTSFNATFYCNIFRYTGAGLASGTTVTPSPLRDAASASTATAKLNATLSGTSKLLHVEPVPATAAVAYQFPFDMVNSPGSALVLICSTTAGSTTPGAAVSNIAIYYEDLHLARSL